MPQMTPSDVFNHELVIGLVSERLFPRTIFLNSGYVGDARSGAQMSVKGDKVTVVRSVPVDANKGVQVNPRSGTPVTADTMQFTSDDYNIVSRMLAYDMDERAIKILANTVDPDSYVADEVIKLASAHLQKALIDAGVNGGLPFVDQFGSVNWKGLRRAMTLHWGENMDLMGEPLLVCHPNVMYDLICSDEVQKSGLFGGSSVIQNGVVYKFAGLNLMQLGSIPKVGDSYKNLIVTPGALQLFQDEEMGYYEQRKAHTTTWQLDWDFSFAAFMTKQKPTGVIVYEVPSTLDSEPETEPEP